MKFLFKTSNNEVEYEGLLAGMENCNALGAKCLNALYDSQLMVSQVRGNYESRDLAMVAYLEKVNERSSMFKKFEIEHVPRSENR